MKLEIPPCPIINVRAPRRLERRPSDGLELFRLTLYEPMTGEDRHSSEVRGIDVVIEIASFDSRRPLLVKLPDLEYAALPE